MKIEAAQRLRASDESNSDTLKYLYRIYRNQKLKKVGDVYMNDLPNEIIDKMINFMDAQGFKKVGNAYKRDDETVKITPGRMEGTQKFAIKISGDNAGTPARLQKF